MCARFQAPTGHPMTAQGKALGYAPPTSSRALKGRHHLARVAVHQCVPAVGSAPSGRGIVLSVEPGALPRAITYRPFRACRTAAPATETQRLTRLYELKQAALAALGKFPLHHAFTGEL